MLRSEAEARMVIASVYAPFSLFAGSIVSAKARRSGRGRARRSKLTEEKIECLPVRTVRRAVP